MLYNRIDSSTYHALGWLFAAGAIVVSRGSINMVSNDANFDSARSISRSGRLWRGLLCRLFGSGWPAALGYRLGFQRRVICREHRVKLARHRANADTAARELRIAFAADFHAGPTTHRRVLQQACAALAAAEADVLLLGGDFVSLRADFVDELTDMLAEIPAPLGKFAVMGNHDIWADRRYITRALEQAGVQVLVNRNVRLAAPYEDFWICGLDDHLLGRPDAASAIQGADGHRIVLMHSPSGLVDLGNNAFDLALCGHTHGGQIALPGGRPIVVPRGPLCRQYAAGRFELDPQQVDSQRRVMIVSRGVGCSTVPLRMFSDPEVMVCQLVGMLETQEQVPAAAALPVETLPVETLPAEAFPIPDSLGAGAV